MMMVVLVITFALNGRLAWLPIIINIVCLGQVYLFALLLSARAAQRLAIMIIVGHLDRKVEGE